MIAVEVVSLLLVAALIVVIFAARRRNAPGHQPRRLVQSRFHGKRVAAVGFACTYGILPTALSRRPQLARRQCRPTEAIPPLCQSDGVVRYRFLRVQRRQAPRFDTRPLGRYAVRASTAPLGILRSSTSARDDRRARRRGHAQRASGCSAAPRRSRCGLYMLYRNLIPATVLLSLHHPGLVRARVHGRRL